MSAPAELDVHKMPRWMSVAGAIFALLSGAGGISAAVFSLAFALMKQEFVTHAALKEHGSAVAAECEAKIETSNAFATQRSAALSQQIESMRKSQDEANARMQNAIDRIYTLLLSRRP